MTIQVVSLSLRIMKCGDGVKMSENSVAVESEIFPYFGLAR